MRGASASSATASQTNSNSARTLAAAQTRSGRRAFSLFKPRVVARFRPRARAGATDPVCSDEPSDSHGAAATLPDLTLPGLTPWQVLGMDATADAFDPTVADARAAFRKQLLLYHPDVYAGETLDATAMTKVLIAALQAVVDGDTASDSDRDSAISPNSGSNPFEAPSVSADAVFVNPFACRGKSCPSYCCCVSNAPEAFGWSESTGAARFRQDAKTWSDFATNYSGDVNDTSGNTQDLEQMAYRLNLAVGQCPVSAIAWVTPAQRLFLEGVELNAIQDWEGGVGMDDTGMYITELLQKARFENGRANAPARRKPKRSTEWVDWYD